MRIGTVQSLWRYPVKSMLGERVTATSIGPLGLPGDRGYAIRDERVKEIRSAKKIPSLFQFSARYVDTPTDTHLPPVEITLPNRATVRTDDPQVHTRLSEAFGHAVTIWPRQPAEDVDHYRRSPRPMEETRQVLGLEEGEPLPSFEGIPPDIFRYVSPLGTYFDAYPLHLLTTSTLQALSTLYPEGQFAPERFRSNIVIATDANNGGNDEPAWKGKTVRVGEVEFLVSVPTIRCVMTTMPQGNLPKDPRILRTIVQQHDHHVGVYATVQRTGEIQVGDSVELLP
ncbi:MAG: MOSC domain-containing protein [Candidatus Binatia bacterium]